VQDKAQKDLKFGVYVHVPFCASTCDFCAFYQETPVRKDLLKFLKNISVEFSRVTPIRIVNTAFWGGGTPGVLPAKDLENLGNAQISHLGQPLEEWTIELAPSTVKPDKLKVLKDLGFNRISLGVQSFDEKMLVALGRRQSAKMARKAYDMIREAGFGNVNIDLIFAVPGQTEEQWLQDLAYVKELAPEHVSTYCLTFEEDTALYVKLSEGKIRQDTEKEARFYEKTWETLDQMGLKQYEISNFARPGYECLHNMNTWRMQEWAGFGPSASSQFQGRRYTNDANLDSWSKGVESNSPVYMEESELTLKELAVDHLIFGLRMNEGVDLEFLKKQFSEFIDFENLETYFEKWESEGIANRKGNRLALSLQGRLVADRLAEELMDFQ
jgi:oxygen-independent coproporphyrinogen-3 oxidase